MRALNRADKPSLKVTNEYINTQSDLTTPFNLKFLLEGASEADSRVFDLMVKNRALIEKTEQPEAVNKKIEKACAATVRKAVEFKDKKLLAEAKQKMKQHYPARAEAFGQESDLKVYGRHPRRQGLPQSNEGPPKRRGQQRRSPPRPGD